MSDPRARLPQPGASRLASPVGRGRVERGWVVFENWRGTADRLEPPPPAPLPPRERVGFAVSGLGRLAAGETLPAFGACGNARLAAVASGEADKAGAVARQHGISTSHILSHGLSHGDTHRFAGLSGIGAVYLAKPNGLHPTHVQAAAPSASTPCARSRWQIRAPRRGP